MIASLPPQAVHLSFEPGPYRMAMGLTACPRADWIELDHRYPKEMVERRDLLATRRDEVFAAVPGSEPARRETWDVLAAHLAGRWPDWFTNDGTTLENRLTGDRWDLAAPGCDPLEAAALLVQEDLCIIQVTGDVPILTAGAVCFPSRWRLGEKIGHPLATVHGPVPFYGERLARPVDRFMGVVKPGHVAVRLNWSMSDDPTLFQPGGLWRTDRAIHITADNAGDALFVRVERQTLSRLPQSGAVLFTIRVHVYPLARIAARAEIAQRLAEAVRGLPPETLHYKSLLPFRDALLDYLGRMSEAVAHS
jgi:dimethylamine monooxygenase subunit A